MSALKWILLIGLISSASGQVDTSFLDKAKVIVVTDTVYGKDELYFKVLSDLTVASKLAQKYAKADIELKRKDGWYRGKIGKRIVGDFYVLKNKVGYFEVYGKGVYKLGFLRVQGQAIARLHYYEISESVLAVRVVFYFFTNNIIAKGTLLLKPSLLPAEAKRIVAYIKVIGRELIFNPTAKRFVDPP